MRRRSGDAACAGAGLLRRESSGPALNAPVVGNRVRVSSTVDDESNRFRAHADFVEEPRQILALSLMVGFGCWLGFRQDNEDPDSNTRAALLGAAIVFLVHCFLQLRDTVFIRPHPGVWRLVHGAGMLYLFALAAMLFQSRKDARRLLSVIFQDLDDPPKPDGQVTVPDMACAVTPQAVWGQLTEIWFVAHVAGWWAKMCIFRDWRLCWVLSVGFEVLELSMGWLVPQFKECWWDSVIVDLLGANLLGMLLGLRTLRFLENRQYDWNGHDPSRQRISRVKRLLARFSPLSWQRWEWEVLSSFKRFAQVGALLLCVLVTELNAFLVLNALDISKNSAFNKARLLILGLVAMPGVSEYYLYINTPGHTRLGQNVWLLLAVMQVEILVWVKFLPNALREASSPDEVTLPWLLALSLFSLWVLLFFTTTKPALEPGADLDIADMADMDGLGVDGDGENDALAAADATADKATREALAEAAEVAAAAAAATAASAHDGKGPTGGDAVPTESNGQMRKPMLKRVRTADVVRWLALDVLFVLSFVPLLYLAKQWYR